jgi:hypothetical protein
VIIDLVVIPCLLSTMLNRSTTHNSALLVVALVGSMVHQDAFSRLCPRARLHARLHSCAGAPGRLRVLASNKHRRCAPSALGGYSEYYALVQQTRPSEGGAAAEGGTVAAWNVETDQHAAARELSALLLGRPSRAENHERKRNARRSLRT